MQLVLDIYTQPFFLAASVFAIYTWEVKHSGRDGLGLPERELGLGL